RGWSECGRGSGLSLSHKGRAAVGLAVLVPVVSGCAPWPSSDVRPAIRRICVPTPSGSAPRPPSGSAPRPPSGSAPRRARSVARSCRRCHPGSTLARLIRRSSSTQSWRFPTNDHPRSDGISCAATYGSVAYAGVGCFRASHPHQKEFGVITTDTTGAIPPVGDTDDDLIQLLTPEGERVHHEAYTPRIEDLDRAALEGLYRD